MRKQLLPLLVAVPLAGRAQQPPPLSPPLAEFKRNFARIEASNEDEPTMALADQTTRKLVAYLKAHDLSAAEAKRIGQDALSR